MARWANRLSPIEASPRVLISDDSWAVQSDLRGSGIELVPIAAGSATASITILALQGPGVINFLQIGRDTDGAGAIGKVVAIIDGEKCYSASYTMSAGFQVVGGGDIYNQFDRLPFREKLTVFLEVSGGSATYSAYLATNWRLTDG